MSTPLFRSLLLSIALTLVGCPGETMPPGTDAGPPMDAPIPPGTDAPIPPGTDAPIPPGTDAPIPPPVDAGPIDAGPDTFDDLCHPTGLSDAAVADMALDILGRGQAQLQGRG